MAGFVKSKINRKFFIRPLDGLFVYLYNYYIKDKHRKEIITTMPLTTENEKKADAWAREQNIKHPMQGMISVHYTK